MTGFYQIAVTTEIHSLYTLSTLLNAINNCSVHQGPAWDWLSHSFFLALSSNCKPWFSHQCVYLALRNNWKECGITVWLCSSFLGWESVQTSVCSLDDYSFPLLHFYLHFYLADRDISQKPQPDVLVLFVIRYPSGICRLAGHCKVLGPSAIIPFFPGSRIFSFKWIPSSFWGWYTSMKRIVLSVLKNSWISRSVCIVDAKGLSDSVRHLDGKFPSSF